MDPLDNEWYTVMKGMLNEETFQKDNVVRSLRSRELGTNPPKNYNNKCTLENIAEDILVQKPLKVKSCDLPGYPRSTFLMVFSPDGTKVASSHGNHNVYVSELASGKHVRILKGHPRTPWCIAFHPSHPELIGSGCLGGQVRVWDISSGGSEVWNVQNETVIASIAFHPREQLLVIATFNEIYFWDWSQPAPFTKVSTNNSNEKVRYVAFDALGYKLITGISLWTSPVRANSNSVLQQNGTINTNNNQNTNNRDDPGDNPGGNAAPENPGSAQDMIVNSYQNLVQRYDSLVRNYQRLFMVRHRFNSTSQTPNTTDRGTDPMDLESSPPLPSWIRNARPIASTGIIEGSPSPSTPRQQDSSDSGDGEGSSSRLLNLDVLSFDTNPPRNRESSNQDHSVFGSRPSAFQPLNDTTRSTFRTIDQDERATRLLPNPFSSSNTLSRSSRITFMHNRPESDNTANSSRTSIFTPSRGDTTFSREFLFRSSDIQNSSPTTTHENLPSSENSTSRPTSSFRSPEITEASNNRSQRPRTTNSSTQISPIVADARAINESLELIRDILRDSGTRLLNLITNMSISTLASVERNDTRRMATGSRTQSENNGRSTGPHPRPSRPLVRFFNSSLVREFLSSSSDSDSDREINIQRTRNSTFRNNSDGDRTTNTAPDSSSTQPTDRLFFELNDVDPNDNTSETRNINVTSSNSRFRVRTQSNSESTSVPSREGGTSGTRAQSTPDLNRPSTSRDDFWSRDNAIPPEEAHRKVKLGLIALQKHTVLLTDRWLRGNRTTMRELRTMWENLRRRVLSLHRESGRQGLPSYYTRSLFERCMLLTDLPHELSRNFPRSTRSSGRAEEGNSNGRDDQNVDNTDSDLTQNMPSTSAGSNEVRQPSRTSWQRRSSTNTRTSPSYRRKVQSNYRWRTEEEIRRRSRNPIGNRLSQRHPNRFRRDFYRSVEISATRHEIRMRAMQVLSAMFNMMMMCLEQRGLSQLIITMLRTLKKALALTCLMLMTNRSNRRSGNNAIPAAQRMESLNVIHIQNVDHSGPINVDDPEDNILPNLTSEPNINEAQANVPQVNNNDNTPTIPNISSTLPTSVNNTITEQSTSDSVTQQWSNRLAVQIAAANRNNSATARNRRELYLESKRLKALHRTNPSAHPLIKKRAVPPISSYRIPALRNFPNRVNLARSTTSRQETLNNEPIAGPSSFNASNQNTNAEPNRHEALNEFEHRVNLIRLAHNQAVRLRNAARNRFRRLQTIRLYTPSSVRVRETFTLPPNMDPQQGNQSQNNETEPGPRRFFATYRSHVPFSVNYTENNEPEQSEEPRQVPFNNPTIPPQVNEGPINSEFMNNQAQRLLRIQEYLQPIILAQNAMVVDEEPNGDGGGGDDGGGGGNGGGGPMGRVGGMAGLLDAGIISEVLPVPSHRVQAWDFTKGRTPEIADSTKNVVVRKCRIHNDASIDISKDGRILVAILPVPVQLRNTNHWLGVYSLDWPRLGQCLHTAVLEQSAVSVALSPTGRHLAVGLGARRFTHHHRSNVFAIVYRLDSIETTGRSGLTPVKELEQNWEQGFTSLNCLRWAPQPGQGLVYANNTGQLIIMS